MSASMPGRRWSGVQRQPRNSASDVRVRDYGNVAHLAIIVALSLAVEAHAHARHSEGKLCKAEQVEHHADRGGGPFERGRAGGEREGGTEMVLPIVRPRVLWWCYVRSRRNLVDEKSAFDQHSRCVFSRMKNLIIPSAMRNISMSNMPASLMDLTILFGIS